MSKHLRPPSQPARTPGPTFALAQQSAHQSMRALLRFSARLEELSVPRYQDGPLWVCIV